MYRCIVPVFPALLFSFCQGWRVESPHSKEDIPDRHGDGRRERANESEITGAEERLGDGG